jgi:hypothetical protein
MTRFDIPLLFLVFDKVQMISVYAGPLLSLVELVRIGFFGHTSGLIMQVWVVFAIMSIAWVIWGMWKHNLAIVINNFINFLIFCGIIGVLIF